MRTSYVDTHRFGAGFRAYCAQYQGIPCSCRGLLFVLLSAAEVSLTYMVGAVVKAVGLASDLAFRSYCT